MDTLLFVWSYVHIRLGIDSNYDVQHNILYTESVIISI